VRPALRAQSAQEKASEIIPLQGPEWAEKQRVAGKVVAEVLREGCALARVPGTAVSAIEKRTAEIILDAGCTATFEGYLGFPAVLCVSVNEVLVHGIPPGITLAEGDLVSLDVGATFEGAIGDAAFTVWCGEPNPKADAMLRCCYAALERAIEVARPGVQVGAIGQAISARADKEGFGVVTAYGGHGLDWNKPHTSPFVPNKGRWGEGARLQANMAIAIEPMFTLGASETRRLEDGWSVVTETLGCHFEHSLLIGEDGGEVMTAHGMVP